MDGRTDGWMRSAAPDLWDGGEGLVANIGWPRSLLLGTLSLFCIPSSGPWRVWRGLRRECQAQWLLALDSGPECLEGEQGISVGRLSHLGETLATYLTSDITRPGQP